MLRIGVLPDPVIADSFYTWLEVTNHDSIPSLPATVTRQDRNTGILDQKSVLTTPDFVREFDVLLTQGVHSG